MATAKKRKSQGALGKGLSGSSKTRIRSTKGIISALRSFGNLSERSQSARSRALHVLADLRRNPNLTFTQAADNRGVSTRSIHKYLRSALRPDESGRIKAKPSDRLRVTLQIPSTKPGEYISFKTTGSKERQLVGQWHSAINAAKSGDFSLFREFPKDQFVGGVRLPTSSYEIQKILAAQAETERKLEGPYRAFSARSA